MGQNDFKVVNVLVLVLLQLIMQLWWPLEKQIILFMTYHHRHHPSGTSSMQDEADLEENLEPSWPKPHSHVCQF